MAPIPVPPGGKGGILNRLDGAREEIVKQAHLLAREVERTLDANYGVAMPEYLRILVARRSSLQRAVRRIVDKFVTWVGADSDPWERRLAEKFGIVFSCCDLRVEVRHRTVDREKSCDRDPRYLPAISRCARVR
jgi:hypothetical protein